MLLRNGFTACLALIVLLLASACEGTTAITTPAATPASGTPAPAVATPAATPSPAPPAIVTPVPSVTPAPPGSMAALAQNLSTLGFEIGALAGSQVSAVQMQQAMDRIATAARLAAAQTLQAPQATPQTRQMMADTLERLAALAARLRERAPELSTDQRRLAVQQAQSIVLEVAQTVSLMQNLAPEATAAEQQRAIGEMQQEQSTIGYLMVQYGFATPTPVAAVTTPSPVLTPSPAR